MSRQRLAAPALVLTLLVAAPLSGQAPQFRADVRQTGDTPFTGTMYFGNARMRIEGTSDGQQMTMIIDAGANSLIMLMPDERMYMTMNLGSAPFSAPGAQSMDPANPCSSGEVTDCTSLGTESVNGYSTRKWEYTLNGERQTSWIASDLRFPVRTVDADGNTTDFTNVALGPQPSSLFEPPADYTAMNMPGLGGFGGGGGRGMPPGGMPPGRGVPPAAAPPGGLPAVPPGVDPSVIAQMQAMGLDSATMAMMLNTGTATESGPWERGDGWVAEIVVTAQGSRTQDITGGGSQTETYSARYTASVPIPYGTPAVGAAVGPAWQLVPGLGSERGLAQPLTLSGTTEYHREVTSPAGCPTDDAFRVVEDARGTGQLRTGDHNSMEMMSAQARFEISGDLRTYNLMVAVGAAGAEATTTTTTYLGSCPGSSASTETETETGEASIGGGFQVTGLPLPSSPTTIRGLQTTPLRFDIGGFSGELPASVEWTLRPIQ